MSHKRRKSRPSSAPHDRKLAVEPLEDRRLLAVVSTLSDVVDGNFTPGNLSLREAIANAGIAEVITFSVTGTIQLTNVNHPGEIAIAKSLTIQGPGADQLTIRAHRGVEGTAGDGSRIFNINDGVGLDQNVLIAGLTMTGGDVNGKGGAILNNENLIVSYSVFSSNATSDVDGNSGGAIYSDLNGELRIGASTFSNNHAGDGGGAIFHAPGNLQPGGFTLATSTLSGNTARFSGGGIFLAGGALTLYNSTLSANAAGFAGGAILNAGGVAVLGHATITGNSAPNGTGSGIASVDNASTSTQLHNTIVSGNFNSDDVAIVVGGVTNRFSSLGYNLIGAGSAALAFANYERGFANPGLAPLANNGGPTLTHALLPNSLAINAGNPTAAAGNGFIPVYDQRGPNFTRVFGKRMDIGAYEHQQLVTAVVDTQADELDSNRGAGDLSLREAIAFADVVTFAPSVHVIQLVTQLSISAPVDIRGPGADSLIIRAGAIRVFNIDNGLAAAAAVSLSAMTLTGGNTTGGGGAILNYEDLTIDACRIVGNTANLGGGIYNAGTLTMSRSTVSDNTATQGGGLYNESVMKIEASTIDSNRYTGVGGGIFNNLAGWLELVNVTISNNIYQRVSSSSGFGGGIYNNGIVDADFVTIARNRSGKAPYLIPHVEVPFGAGIWTASSGITTLGHALLAGNYHQSALSPDEFPVFIIDNLAGPGLVPSSFLLQGREDLIFALADNGGPTFTHALPAGSAAIDAGNPALVEPGFGDTPFNDQRGTPYTRIHGGRIDIGAFEVQPPPTLTPSADFDADGDRDGADFLRWQRGLGLTGALATRANGNADNDSDVDAADLTIWRNTFGAAAAATEPHAVANLVAASEPAAAASRITHPQPSPSRGGSRIAESLSPTLVDAAMAYHQLLADAAPRHPLRTRLRR